MIKRTAVKYSDPKVCVGVVTKITDGLENLEDAQRLNRRAYNKQISYNRRTGLCLYLLKCRLFPELRELTKWVKGEVWVTSEDKKPVWDFIKKINKDKNFVAQKKDLYARLNVLQKKARRNLQNKGLLWSFKNATMDQAKNRKVNGKTVIPMRFRSWRENRGTLTLLRQRNTKRKIDVPTLEECMGQWDIFQMKPIDYNRHKNSKNRSRKKFHVKFSLGQKSFVEFEVLFWNLPDLSSKVSIVSLTQNDKGWTLNLTCEASSKKEQWFFKPCDGKGSVSCDFGWREREDGTRIAMFLGEDGVAQEVVLPPTYAKQWDMVEVKKSKIDLDFNEMKESLVSLPVDHWKLWRNPERFSDFFVKWREEGGHGKEYDILESWYVIYHHDKRHMDGRRSNLIEARDHYFKTFAKQLARDYDTILMDTIDLRSIAETMKGKPNRNRQRAGISEFRRALVGCGIKVEEPKCEWTSRTCSNCKQAGEKSKEEVLECEHCGHKEDRDLRACRNLLGKNDFDQIRFETKVVKIRALFGRKFNRAKALETTQV